MKRSVLAAGITGVILVLTGLFTGCEKREEAYQEETLDEGSRKEPDFHGTPGSSVSSVRVLEDLGAESSLLFAPLYLAGDSAISCMVSIDPDDGESFMDSHRIQLFFSDHCDMDQAVARLVLEPGKNSYDTILKMQVYTDGTLTKETEEKVHVMFAADGQTGTRVEVNGAEKYGGTYYPKNNYEEIGLAERFYTRAELAWLSDETLSLLRNTVYACHGRKFKTERLNEYFGQKLWYRGVTEPEAFTEDRLTDTERANVRLIQELENIPFKERIKEGYKGPEGISAAPYLPFLLKQKEGSASFLTGNAVCGDTGISFDMAKALDQGEYFTAPGVIFSPVTVTPEQMKAVRAGGQAEVTVDELTGKTKVLEMEDETLVLHEKGETALDPGGNPYMGVSYDYEKSVYKLRQDSDDTIMKPVYKGEIRIAKGAVCGGHVSLLSASAQSRELNLSGEEGGNWILYDSKGTILAVYYLGD